MSFPTLILTKSQINEMLINVNINFPEEACGLIAGINGHAISIRTITNIEHSETRFRMDPREQLQFLLEIDNNNWDLIGIYHSHPNGPNYPSMTDLKENSYPGIVHIIWSKEQGNWTFKAFNITLDSFKEITVRMNE